MRQKKLVIYFLEFVVLILSIVLSYLILTNFVLRPVQIKGSSMYPTLKNEERAYTNVFSTLFGEIERFDIVVVKADNHRDLVKRVIGLPNETVEVRNNVLYINGKQMAEPFLAKSVVTSDFTKVVLKENEYFVMGDNRSASHDSRQIGPFSRDKIISRHAYIYYPFNEMRILK